MRIPAAILLLLLAGCAARPAQQLEMQICADGEPGMNCSGDSPVPVTDDRNWIPADAAVYGITPQYGFFRFALNQQQPQPLGNPAAGGMNGLLISPDKTKVFADALGPGVLNDCYVYDVKSARLHDLSKLIAPYSFTFISPDWRYIAWNNVHDPAVHILDLRHMTSRAISLPAAQKMVPISALWMADGDVLVTSRQWHGTAWAYWRVNPATGAVSMARKEDGAGAYNSLMTPSPHPVDQITTASGAVVVHIGQALIVRGVDGTQTVVETAIPPVPASDAAYDFGKLAHGKPVALWGVLDNDIVLYSFGEDMWVYGIAEHKKSLLGPGFLRLVF